MVENEKTLLLLSLQNGIGLSSACEISMLDIKEVSDYIKKDTSFHKSCLMAIKSTVAGNLEFMQKLKKEKKFSEWHRQQEKMKLFISDLTLWESYCKKEDVKTETLMQIAHYYKTIEECATAIGFTKRELIDYIIKDSKLSYYFNQTGKLNF